MGFIEQIAPIIKKYAPIYDIKVVSPIIAQAVIESEAGTSELAVNANNYFGLKYRKERMKPWVTTYLKIATEQRADGTTYSYMEEWGKFKDMEDGVVGYFDFTNIPHYANLKNVTDPKVYVNNLKLDGYATSLIYVQTILAAIDRYNLTQYDTDEKLESKPGPNVRPYSFNIHAGHGLTGSTGAVGLLNESVENRRVKDKVIELLRANGHTAYDCTVDNGSQKSILKDIVTKCNEHTVDLDVSIHFNAGANRPESDGATTGTEVIVYSSSSVSKEAAERVCKAISDLGFKNRGVKYSTSLYFLSKTKSPAMLIEVCFVDDKDDAELYQRLGADAVAEAIVKGLLGVSSLKKAETIETPIETPQITQVVPQKKENRFFNIKFIEQKKTQEESNKTEISIPVTNKKSLQALKDFIDSAYNEADMKFSVNIYVSYPEKTEYLVRIKSELLNVRSGPGMSYDVVRTVSKGSVYTIIEQIGSWGRLKSGVGWINTSDSFCERV